MFERLKSLPSHHLASARADVNGRWIALIGATPAGRGGDRTMRAFGFLSSLTRQGHSARADARPQLACRRLAAISEPRRQRLTGVFLDAALEREFLQDYYRRSVRRTATVTYVIGAIVLSAYAAIDYAVLPEAHPWPLVLRFGLLVPVVSLLLLLVLRAPWYERWHNPLMLGGLWVLTGVVAAIGLAAPSPARELYVSTASVFGLACSACRVSVRATIAYHAGVLAMLAIGAATSELAWTTQVFLALNICGIGCFAVMGSRIVESGARTNFLQRRTIEAERQRSERLLLNILPRSVADRLKQGQVEIADAHGDVSVLFADLVGFTSFSARLAPSELVRRLNTLFTEFDRLTERYAVEKIKTIGDAYMVAAGVPEPIENGAEALTDLALDMLDACQRLGDGLEIRAGLHSGPAVAGVIGTRKFSYDLWGDTVNTAARMESHGVPGKIQITDDTRRRLGP